MIQSKHKGNAFERQVCGILKERFNQPFNRVPTSGAIGTAQKDILTEEAKGILTGDIICPKNFRFSVECKSRKEFSLWGLLGDAKETEWLDWWKQACEDAHRANKQPIVIVKYNNRKILAFIDGENEAILYNASVRFVKYEDFLVCLLDNILKFPNESFFKQQQS